MENDIRQVSWYRLPVLEIGWYGPNDRNYKMCDHYYKTIEIYLISLSVERVRFDSCTFHNIFLHTPLINMYVQIISLVSVLQDDGDAKVGILGKISIFTTPVLAYIAGFTSFVCKITVDIFWNPDFHNCPVHRLEALGTISAR